MMVLIAHLRMARFFSATVQWIGARVHQPALLLVVIVFVSGILSALFVNDTICLVFTPILIELARARGHRPLPYLLALATGSNIGSVATITGNPQNMLIASLSHIRYRSVPRGARPGRALRPGGRRRRCSVWMFRADLRPGPLEAAGPAPRPLHRAMMIKGLLVTAGVLVAFLLGDATRRSLPPSRAAALLITRRVNPQKIYRQIDWDLLVLFIGLFVVIGGVEHVGLAQRLFDLLAPIGLDTVTGLSLVTAVAVERDQQRAGRDAALAARPAARRIPQTSWLTLAMASTLAGNLTLVGSIANLIVLEGARRHGVEISFWQYLQGRRAGHRADAALRHVVAELSLAGRPRRDQELSPLSSPSRREPNGSAFRRSAVKAL